MLKQQSASKRDSQLKRVVRQANNNVRRARDVAYTRFIEGHVQGMEGETRKRDKLGT